MEGGDGFEDAAAPSAAPMENARSSAPPATALRDFPEHQAVAAYFLPEVCHINAIIALPTNKLRDFFSVIWQDLIDAARPRLCVPSWVQ
jgi:hypothetical protein